MSGDSQVMCPKWTEFITQNIPYFFLALLLLVSPYGHYCFYILLMTNGGKSLRELSAVTKTFSAL